MFGDRELKADKSNEHRVLPRPRSVGDIIRLHRVKASRA
jgi:hypothetical protein